ncbi:MAG TPA: glycoside hydrolase family 30 beta sandwich domain-containing protein [Clostridium sp.]
MTAVHNAYPTKDNWFTEGSDGSWAGDGSWHDSFKQHMAKAIRVTRNWSKSVLWWNMALDENNGPTVLDKSTCYGVVTVNQLTGAVSYNADYYTLGQFSKFVDSGAYRIESNSFDNDVEDVAFKNPDGSKVIVVNNTNTVDKSVKVKWGSESFTYTIPADSVITFKWSGSQSGSQTIVKPAWYQNFETGSGFTAGTNATVATDSSSANTGGSKSVNLTTSASGDPGSSAQCVNVLPPNENLIDTSPYGYLNFYVKDTQGVNTVKLTFVDKNNAEYSTWTTTRSAKDKWIPINFALCSITGIDKTAIKEIRVGEWNPGVYYFDDFYLSADSTLVIPAFGIDKTTLTTAINDATTLIGSKTVGTEVDNVPQAAKDTYQGAITAATAVSTNTASTQADIDAQVSALATATTNFNSAVIAAPVKWFQNFSAGNGFSSDTQVTTEVATDHANIMDGNSVKMTMSSLAGGYWDNTVAHPADNTKNIKITPMGLATFDATNYSYLIFYVKDMAGSNNNIHIKLKDNLGATWNLGTNDINRATPHFGVQGTWTKIVVTLDKTQALDWSKISEISIQEYWNYSNVYYFDDLYFAQNPINNPPAVNKAALTTAISDATTLIESKTVGTAVGNVPQAATDTFQSAITASTAVIANTAATQAEANAQVAALATATTNFNSAVIIVHESVNPVWYQNFEIGSGFTAGTNATVTTDSSSANRGGLDSVKLTTSASGDPQRSAQCVNVIPQIGTSFDVSSYSYLNFYVKDTQGANTLKLTFVDKDNAEYSMWADQTSSVKDQWTKINCQLSSITGIDKTAIKEIRVGEWNIGVYYFDDFYFSADSTFVIPAFAVDKTELTTATGNAITLIGSKTVGTAVGNVPQAATDTFQSAITASTAVIANTAATQAEANAQIAALATATTNFNSAVIVVNRAALTKAISDATTLIGSKTVGAANGNVPQGAKDDFQSTITAAGIVNENEAATQLAVDAQVTAIATATTNFNNAVIVVNRAALTKVISDATTLIGSKTVGAAVGNVTQIAKDTFQSAITVATAVNTDMKATQADVDAQVSTLATATINFNNALIVAPDKGLQRWVKKIKAQLDNFVKTGIITQNQEDEILKFVNSTKDRDFKKKVKKIKTKLDSLVKAGTITKAQENAIVKFVTHNILEYL